jgi:hypothetical protein
MFQRLDPLSPFSGKKPTHLGPIDRAVPYLGTPEPIARWIMFRKPIIAGSKILAFRKEIALPTKFISEMKF